MQMLSSRSRLRVAVTLSWLSRSDPVLAFAQW